MSLTILRQRMACIKPGLVAKRRLHAHRRLRVLRDVGEFRRTGADEELRDPAVVEIFLNRRVGRGADRAEQESDALELDELARLLHRLGR